MTNEFDSSGFENISKAYLKLLISKLEGYVLDNKRQTLIYDYSSSRKYAAMKTKEEMLMILNFLLLWILPLRCDHSSSTL